MVWFCKFDTTQSNKPTIFQRIKSYLESL
jgi:hypothetical protein